MEKLVQGHPVAKWKSMNLKPDHQSQRLHFNTLLRRKLIDTEPSDLDSSLFLESGFY